MKSSRSGPHSKFLPLAFHVAFPRAWPSLSLSGAVSFQSHFPFLLIPCLLLPQTSLGDSLMGIYLDTGLCFLHSYNSFQDLSCEHQLLLKFPRRRAYNRLSACLEFHWQGLLTEWRKRASLNASQSHQSKARARIDF